MRKYKGYTIEHHLTGWYSVYTPNGILKADTIRGIKKLINYEK